MISIELLQLLSPELGARPEAPAYLTLAAQRLDPESWGSVYQQGAVYLALHLMEEAQPSGGSAMAAGGAAAAGPVTSIRTGDQAVSYGQIQGSPEDAPYLTTRWGRQYIALRRQAVHAFAVS